MASGNLTGAPPMEGSGSSVEIPSSSQARRTITVSRTGSVSSNQNKSLNIKLKKEPVWKAALFFPEDKVALTSNWSRKEMEENCIIIPVNALFYEKKTGTAVPPMDQSMFCIISHDYIRKTWGEIEGQMLIDNVTRYGIGGLKKKIDTGRIPLEKMEWIDAGFLEPMDDGPNAMEEALDSLFTVQANKTPYLRYETRATAKKTGDSQQKKKQTFAEQQAEANQVTVASFHNGSHEGTVSFASYQTLKPETYINDEIIDLGITLFIKASDSRMEDIAYMTVQGWQFVFAQYDFYPERRALNLYKLFTNFGRNSDAHEINFIVFPVSRESHWLLAIICHPFPTKTFFEAWKTKASRNGTGSNAEEFYRNWLMNGDEVGQPTVLLYDSLHMEMVQKVCNYQIFHANCGLYLTRGLRFIHMAHWHNLGETALFQAAATAEFESIIPIWSMPTPPQDNSYDCGLFVMVCAKLFFFFNKRMSMTYKEIMDVSMISMFEHKHLLDVRSKLTEYIKFKCARDAPQTFQNVFEQPIFNLADIKREVEEVPEANSPASSYSLPAKTKSMGFTLAKPQPGGKLPPMAIAAAPFPISERQKNHILLPAMPSEETIIRNPFVPKHGTPVPVPVEVKLEVMLDEVKIEPDEEEQQSEFGEVMMPLRGTATATSASFAPDDQVNFCLPSSLDYDTVESMTPYGQYSLPRSNERILPSTSVPLQTEQFNTLALGSQPQRQTQQQNHFAADPRLSHARYQGQYQPQDTWTPPAPSPQTQFASTFPSFPSLNSFGSDDGGMMQTYMQDQQYLREQHTRRIQKPQAQGSGKQQAQSQRPTPGQRPSPGQRQPRGRDQHASSSLPAPTPNPGSSTAISGAKALNHWKHRKN